MAHDVFISYSSIDKTVAETACAALERRGARCWLAARDLAPGCDWGDSAAEAISRSRVMVLVFSDNANSSAQVKREVEWAVNQGVAVVPLRIENVPLCATLANVLSKPQWLDAHAGPLQRHLDTLTSAVCAMLGMDSVECPPAATRPAVQVYPAARPQRRGLRKAGVPTALAVGLLCTLVFRAMVSSTPSAANAESADQLATPPAADTKASTPVNASTYVNGATPGVSATASNRDQ